MHDTGDGTLYAGSPSKSPRLPDDVVRKRLTVELVRVAAAHVPGALSLSVPAVPAAAAAVAVAAGSGGATHARVCAGASGGMR